MTVGWESRAAAAQSAQRTLVRCRLHLHEVVFDLLEQAFFRRRIIHRQGVAQLFQQSPLLARKPGGNLNLDANQEVAATAAVYDRDALIAEAELRAALRALGNFELARLAQRGYF